ncbi:MAG: S8 family serine peptidase [Thermoguttaceae bacterium]|nr:S8 family serine peptidase [Thermoguttaceae bacterium]
MSINKLFYRFFGIVTIVALLSVSLFAQEKAVPTTYSSFLDAVNAPYAWNMGYTGQGVVVGVIDDSINMSHPFYSSNIDTASAYNTGVIYNNSFFKQFMDNLPTQSVNNTSAVWDNGTITLKDNGGTENVTGDFHGTDVTGCIAAYSASTNTYGPAYNATLVPIRADFKCQSFPVTYYGISIGDYTFGDAVKYDNSQIDIKNNSYGNSMGYISRDADYIVQSIEDARANNTLLLYSAGNERNKTNYSNNKDCTKRITNGHPYTITVAATGKNYSRDYTGFAPFSNYGACVFITAPGVGIRTSDREDVTTGNIFTFGYDYESTTSSVTQGSIAGNMNGSFNGTSASCPVAVGTLALAMEAFKETYPDIAIDARYFKQLLARTSTKIDTSATAPEVKWTTNAAGISFSHSYGFGQINAQGLIDAILDPESVLGDNYNSVTQQTAATFDWSTLEVSPAEMLVYSVTYPNSSGNSGSSYMTTFGISEDEIQAAAAEYQSGSAAYVTPNYFEFMAANDPIYIDTLTISNDAFLNSGIVKQDMEEVVVTIDVKADDSTKGFDPRYMQIVLDHNGVQSYLAFADTNSPKYNTDSLTWSFCSNAFWGEDPTGDWTLSVYDLGSDFPFSVNDVFSTFYMGALDYTNPAVPEPATLALMALGVVGLIYWRKRKN